MPFSRTFEQLLHINCAALVSSTLTFKTRTNHPQGFLCHYQAEVQSQVNGKLVLQDVAVRAPWPTIICVTTSVCMEGVILFCKTVQEQKVLIKLCNFLGNST